MKNFLKDTINNLKNTINDFFESEKVNQLAWICVAIGSGICCYFALDNEPNAKLNATVFGINATVFGIWKIYEYISRNKEIESDENRNDISKNDESNDESNNKNCIHIVRKIFAFLISASFFISFGFFIAQIRTMHVNTFMIDEKSDRPISFVATIDSCEKTQKGLKFIVSKIKRKYDDETGKLCAKFNKLHLIWIGENARNTAEDYSPGNQYLFRASLSPIRPQAFPNAYDFRRQAFFKGISARGFILKQPKLLQKPSQNTFSVCIENIRHKIDGKIEQYLKKDTAAIAKALVTGNTAGITKDVRQKFSDSGTAHLLAISGLHIGIIGFFIFWLVRILLLCLFTPLSMFCDIKKISAVISWIVVLAYLQISGRSVSSIRAFIMYSIVILAVLMNRKPFTMRSVAIAALIIMLYSPEVVIFPSFQMSFGAVIAIVAFVECQFEPPKILKWLWETIIITIIASVPTSFISIAVFNQLTLNSIPANIICIPLMTFFIMPLLILSMPFILLDFYPNVITIAGFGIDSLAQIVEKIAQFPGSHFTMATPSDLVFGMMAVSFLIFALLHNRIRFIGLIGMIFAEIMYQKQELPNIFVAPYAKTIGIRNENSTCFSHLGYFRSIGEAWSKSVGAEKRYNFKEKECEKCTEKFSKSTLEQIKINNKQNQNAKIIYLNPYSEKEIKKHRPWFYSDNINLF